MMTIIKRVVSIWNWLSHLMFEVGAPEKNSEASCYDRYDSGVVFLFIELLKEYTR